MDLKQLRVDHDKAMANLNIIDLFIDDNYNRGNRVEIKKLARKLRVKDTDVMHQLVAWVKAYQHTREARVHRLCIFLTELHSKPQYFGWLPLSTEEHRQIQHASRHMGLPSRKHWMSINELIEKAGAWDAVATQLNHAKDIAIGSLSDHGFLPEGVKPEIVTTGEAVRNEYKHNHHSGHDKFGDIQMYHSWGYLAFEKLDKLKVQPNESEDFLIMKPSRSFEETNTLRKEAQRRLRSFIDEVQDRGLMFVQVQLHPVRSGDKFGSCPLLVFSLPNELSATIKIAFTQYIDLGRFVLDR